MSINFTTASIKNGLTDAKPLFLDIDEDAGVSGRYSQLDIADFEEALFSDKIHDEHSIFTGLGEDKKTVGEYVDPMKDESYAKFAGEMKEMINSVTDPIGNIFQIHQHLHQYQEEAVLHQLSHFLLKQ